MVFAIILGIVALIAVFDLLFLFIRIIKEKGGAPTIVSWICYPFFGLFPLPLFFGLLFRILEGGIIFLFIGRLLF